MRIAFTFNVKPKASGADTDDRYAEWDDEATIDAVEAALSRAGEVIRVDADDDLPFRLRDVRPDIVFNIAEGLGGPNREAHVPALCEFWSMPYTGSDSMTLSLCLDKGRTRRSSPTTESPTAPFTVAAAPEELDGFAAWPAIVKPVHEGSSKGITAASFCRSREEVLAAIDHVVGRYRQPALVERYLPRPGVHLRDPRQRSRHEDAAHRRGRLRGPPPGRAADLHLRGQVGVGLGGDAPRHLPLPGGGRSRPRGRQSSGRRSPPTACCAAGIGRASTSAATSAGCPTSSRSTRCPASIPIPRSTRACPTAARAAGLDYADMILGVLRAAAARHGLAL